MIYYLLTFFDHHTIEGYLKDRGRHWSDRIKMFRYEHLARVNSLPIGTYIFTDLDRLRPNQMTAVRHLYDFLSEKRPDLTLLNNPHHFVGRFDLLRQLYESGRNRFNVYRHTELDRDIQFPVFLRFEHDHLGARSDLLTDRRDMEGAVLEALMSGAASDNLMVVEFLDTRDSQGVFRKYSAWRWGRFFAARHLVFGKDWMLKVPVVDDGGIWPAEWVAEEEKFIRTNPHLHQVREAFELANIDFGRMDYSVIDGQIQVWEINTNPRFFTPRHEQIPERLPLDEIVSERFDEAWEQIDCRESPRPAIPFQIDLSLFERQTSTA